jgi:hypothetical protein
MKNSGHFFKVLLPLAGLLLLTLMQANPGLAKVYTIPPHADVFVDSQNPDTNYQGQPDLYVEYYPDFLGSPLTQRTYLKFDLSVIPAGSVITAAKLYLFVVINDGHPSPVANLYHVGDIWSKFSLTWNNAPPAGNFLASRGDMFWGSYYSWDLFQSGLWNPAPDLADKRLSLLLKLAAEGQLTAFAGYAFSSTASIADHPYLEVTAVPPASPAANLLLLTD